jgi:hypothetical protein
MCSAINVPVPADQVTPMLVSSMAILYAIGVMVAPKVPTLPSALYPFSASPSFTSMPPSHNYEIEALISLA